MNTTSDTANSNWAVYAAATLTVLFWGSAFPAIRYAVGTYSPQSLMLLRFLIASSALAVIGVFKKIRLPKKKDLPIFALGGLIGVFLYMLFSKNGAVHIEAGIGSFIVAASPVFVLILSSLLLKEKVRPAGWVSISVSFVGLVIIMISQTDEFVLNIGVLLFLLATLCTSFHVIIQRKITRSYTALEATTYCILFATLMMLIYVPGLVRELPQSNLSANLVVVYLGIFPAALGYFSWGWAISKAKKAANVAMFQYLAPLVSSVLGYFWLGEILSAAAIIGGILIILGMVMNNMLGRD